MIGMYATGGVSHSKKKGKEKVVLRVTGMCLTCSGAVAGARHWLRSLYAQTRFEFVRVDEDELE